MIKVVQSPMAKVSYVLKNGENSLEFTNKRSMLAYYERFLKLFPNISRENIAMYKVVVYSLNVVKPE